MNAINHILQHWKTSAAGVVLGPAVFHLVQSGCGTANWHDWAWKIGAGAATLVLGLIAKDPGSKP